RPRHLPAFPTRRSSDLFSKRNVVMAGGYPLQIARSTGNGPVLPPFQQSRHQKQFSLARRILLPRKGHCKVGKRESAVYGRAEHRSEEHTSELQSRENLV